MLGVNENSACLFHIRWNELVTFTVVPELMKIFHFFSYLSDSKDQTIIEKILLANDRGNSTKQISIQIFKICDLD